MAKKKSPEPTASSNNIPDWQSLWLLLDRHSTAELANAIDHHGIFVIDEFGRRVLALDGPVSDRRSKAFAKLLLAQRYAELEDPGPQYSWEHERWDTEPHPTHYFGWPLASLPKFNSNAQGVSPAAISNLSVPWTQRPAKEFIEEKSKAGSYEAAGELHGVSRQRYTEIYKGVIEGKIDKTP